MEVRQGPSLWKKKGGGRHLAARRSREINSSAKE
jgi:hypothetical protein